MRSITPDPNKSLLRLGQIEAYLCGEAEGAWVFRREPDGFDIQIWRLHLTIGAVPR